MIPLPTGTPGPSLRDLAARIDTACDRFEAAWIVGDRPRIEDYLDDVDEPARDDLLDELVVVDVVYRRLRRRVADRGGVPGSIPVARAGLGRARRRGTPAADDRPSRRPLSRRGALGRRQHGPGLPGVRLGPGREVALKVLPPNFSASTRIRLFREARAGARVQHPGVATFYDAGEAGGIDYIAMEYVRGRTLHEVLRDGPLPPERALAIAAVLLEALAHAHTAGILHRDVKPENIMVTGERSAKLLDLGLAKGAFDDVATGADSGGRASARADTAPPTAGPDPTIVVSETNVAPARSGLEGPTPVGVVLGTPGYMAPEQIRGEPVDVRADLFAAGAVLHEMLTGRRLFDGATISERLTATLSSEVVPPVGPALPAGLDAALAKAVARDPAARWPSAGAFPDRPAPDRPRGDQERAGRGAGDPGLPGRPRGSSGRLDRGGPGR